MLGLELNLVFPTGKFTIRNKENGLFLSVVDGALAFTEVKDTNSDWFLVDGNEEWGTIKNGIGKVLDIFMSQCGIDSCPVGLYHNNAGNGYLTSNQRWRRSGDKIVSAFPGYLAQDDSENLVAIESPSDGNKHWTRLEIGNILNRILWFIEKALFIYYVFRKYRPCLVNQSTPFNYRTRAIISRG